ncbi:MAG TPA: polysaccharide biosynthesis/export family protein [Pyrinomonadaceae bacterium]|nr:polysaccharide biosynthesis/export family protein [Pyrinomonadaceae bacterium]
MKKHTLSSILLMLALLAASVASVLAQDATPAQPVEKEQRGGVMGKIFGQGPKKDDAQKTEAQSKTSSQSPERLEADDTNPLPSDVPADIQAGRREQTSEEEAAIVPYYNNFLSSYHIGPEDVISVTVLGQERYSKANITVPPDGRISYPLIPEGVVVVGKTTRQIQDELTKRLDEYIIDPQITVSLDKAVSATYSVIGDVAQPGVRVMTRRYSILDALAMAGGILNTGDKSKVFILRKQADGNVHPIQVNIKEIERGRAKEMAFLVPGDQVVVPGNRFKKIKQWGDLLSIVSFAKIFAGGW